MVVARAVSYERCNLVRVQPGSVGVCHHVYAPLVFSAALCGDASNDDFALPEGEVTSIEEPRIEHFEEQSTIAGQRGEENQRVVASHDGVNGALDVGRKRSGCRINPSATIIIACHGCDDTHA